MSLADKYYQELIKDINANGIWDKDQNVRTKWKDGTPAYTKSVIAKQLKFNNSEIPILTQKRVAWKTAIKELLWIWQMKSNKVQDLRDMGVNIWNEWELEDGTIGKAYGYQLGKKNQIIDGLYVDQVDYLIYQLKNNPSSRRHITTLWNPDDIPEMSLTPCVWKTQWLIKENKLSLIVEARSNDIGLGHPFNVFQYNILQRMMAQICNYDLGEYIYQIGDAHIYERHITPLNEQILNKEYNAPTLWINPNINNFYDFTINDFKLLNYNHGPTINMEVAI